MVSRTRGVAADLPDQIVAQQGAVGRGAQRIAQDVILALEADAVEASRHRVEDLVGAERLEHEIAPRRRAAPGSRCRGRHRR